MAERFPGLARHWDVLRAAWSRQNAADAAAKPSSDPEFLPAALEIMEKPPSPGFRYLMLGLCALFAIAILWSFIGRVDVVAVASGKTLPVANSKTIQPIEIGAIRAIHVRNGQRVKKGQLLIELDPTIAGADEAAAGRGLMAAQIAEARNDALIGHLEGRGGRFATPAGTPGEVAATQRALVRSSIAEYEAERASLAQARAEQAANLAASEAEITKLKQTLPLVERQLEARKDLASRGYFSKLRVLEYEQLRVEHIQNIAVQEANAMRARAAIANLDAQRAKVSAAFAKTSATDLATARDEASVRAEELRKSSRRREYQAIRSPVDGTVQQLAVSTIGGIVQPAQLLMVIVPDGGEVAVEAYVQNKDVGFVREGQEVRVKLEAFPFTDYGLIPGSVETLSRDAIEIGAPGQPGGLPANTPTAAKEGGRAAPQGLVYAARIRLARRTIKAGGREMPIGPGLSVQAEIVTGKRRIIDYLLSPISKAMDEAGRER
jgi:hemolysin D